MTERAHRILKFFDDLTVQEMIDIRGQLGQRLLDSQQSVRDEMLVKGLTVNDITGL
jgi:hypothetical protein